MSRDDPFGLSEDRERTRIRFVGAPARRGEVPPAGGTAVDPQARATRTSSSIASPRCSNSRPSSKAPWRRAIRKPAHAPPRRTDPRQGRRGGGRGIPRQGGPGRMARRRSSRRSGAQYALGRGERVAAPAAGGHAARRRRCRHAVLHPPRGARAASEPRPRSARAAILLPGTRLPRQIPRAGTRGRPLAQRRSCRRRPLPARRRCRRGALVAELEGRRRAGRAAALHRADLGDAAGGDRDRRAPLRGPVDGAQQPGGRSLRRSPARCRRRTGSSWCVSRRRRPWRSRRHHRSKSSWR